MGAETIEGPREIGNFPLSRAEIPILQTGIISEREDNIHPITEKSDARERETPLPMGQRPGETGQGYTLCSPMYLSWVRIRLRVEVDIEELLGTYLDGARHVEMAPESWERQNPAEATAGQGGAAFF